MKKFTGTTKILTALLLMALLLAAALDTRLRVVRYQIPARTGKGIVIALVSDLHSCRYGEGQETLLAAIRAQHPDVVLLAGDIVDDKLPEENAFVFLRKIARDYPTYYVTGNHEYWSGQVDRIKADIRQTGVIVLEGEKTDLQIRAETIDLFGVEDKEAGSAWIDSLRALSGRRGEAASILLTHRPEDLPLYAELGFDIVLAGHAHGGQWRIPGILNGLFAPDQGFFPKYAGGEYTEGGTRMIVSRGLALESTRIPRIFNRPELVIITLESSEP